MKKLLPIALFMFSQVQAATLPLSDLGNLSLSYTTATKTAEIPLAKATGVVSAYPGAGFSVSQPMAAQQVNWLVDNGVRVEQGQPIARLSGPAVAHFRLEYDSARQLYQLAREQYQTHQSLYQNQSLTQSQWLDTSARYFEQQANWHHIEHLAEWLTFADGGDSATLQAPRSGFLQQHPVSSGEHQSVLATVIPDAALRLRITVSQTLAGRVSHIETAGCRLSIERHPAASDGFFKTLWSQPLGTQCGQSLGASQSAALLSENTGFLVPASAVFQWQSSPHILFRQNQQLQSVPVNILASDNNQYWLSFNHANDQIDVLTESVSAVQGLMLGLGGE